MGLSAIAGVAFLSVGLLLVGALILLAAALAREAGRADLWMARTAAGCIASGLVLFAASAAGLGIYLMSGRPL